MATKTDGTPDDVEQLKARIAELEAALRRERRKEADAQSDSMRDAMNRVTDEYGRLFRGFTTAYLEGLSAAADVAGTFFKGVQERSETRRTPGASVAGATDQIRDLGTGCTSAFTDAISKAVEVPRRSVDKFNESYEEAKPS